MRLSRSSSSLISLRRSISLIMTGCKKPGCLLVLVWAWARHPPNRVKSHIALLFNYFPFSRYGRELVEMG